MKKSKKLSVTLNVVLILLLLAAGSWFVFKYRKERSDLGKKYAASLAELETYKKDPNAAAQAEANKTIEAVSKVYALPKNETPTVGTVKDDQEELKKLKEKQPFFADAQPGDVTLIYAQAKLAVLYRPSTNQVINVSSVTIQDQQNQPAATQP